MHFEMENCPLCGVTSIKKCTEREKGKHVIYIFIHCPSREGIHFNPRLLLRARSPIPEDMGPGAKGGGRRAPYCSQ
jgi:hypothetical protein